METRKITMAIQQAVSTLVTWIATLMFVALKLMGVIGWPWWQVFSPVWVMYLLILLAIGVGYLWGRIRYRRYKSKLKGLLAELDEKIKAEGWDAEVDVDSDTEMDHIKVNVDMVVGDAA